MAEYQINSQACTYYSNTAVYGENEYGTSGHLYYFHSFEALNDAS